MKPESILFATDLSSRCDRALDRATQLATQWQARLVALHAQVDDSHPSMPWRAAVPPRTVALQRLRADLADATDIDIDIFVERGDPATLILALCKRLGCDLIITGVARSETLGRWLLGTTVDKVARGGAGAPLLVVKSRPQGRPYRRVIVATDLSEGAQRAFEAALTLFHQAQVSLFHAYDVVYESFHSDHVAARQLVGEAARAELEQLVAATPAATGRTIGIRAEYGHVETELGRFVDPSTQCASDGGGADLVVIGTSGRSGLARAFLGSVSQRLLKTLPGDVLLVPPAG